MFPEKGSSLGKTDVEALRDASLSSCPTGAYKPDEVLAPICPPTLASNLAMTDFAAAVFPAFIRAFAAAYSLFGDIPASR